MCQRGKPSFPFSVFALLTYYYYISLLVRTLDLLSLTIILVYHTERWLHYHFNVSDQASIPLFTFSNILNQTKSATLQRTKSTKNFQLGWAAAWAVNYFIEVRYVTTSGNIDFEIGWSYNLKRSTQIMPNFEITLQLILKSRHFEGWNNRWTSFSYNI